MKKATSRREPTSKRTAKKVWTESEKQAQWDRAVAIQVLCDTDLYCVESTIAGDDEGLSTTSLHSSNAYRKHWHLLDELSQKEFEPEKLTEVRIMVDLIGTFDLAEPLSCQVAEWLKKMVTRLSKSVEDLTGYEQYEDRDVAVIKKLSKGQLNPVFSPDYVLLSPSAERA